MTRTSKNKQNKIIGKIGKKPIQKERKEERLQYQRNYAASKRRQNKEPTIEQLGLQNELECDMIITKARNYAKVLKAKQEAAFIIEEARITSGIVQDPITSAKQYLNSKQFDNDIKRVVTSLAQYPTKFIVLLLEQPTKVVSFLQKVCKERPCKARKKAKSTIQTQTSDENFKEIQTEEPQSRQIQLIVQQDYKNTSNSGCVSELEDSADTLTEQESY